MDYKALYERERKRSEKMKEISDFLIQCIENGFDYKVDTITLNQLESEISAIEAESGEERDKNCPKCNSTNIIWWMCHDFYKCNDCNLESDKKQ